MSLKPFQTKDIKINLNVSSIMKTLSEWYVDWYLEWTDTKISIEEATKRLKEGFSDIIDTGKHHGDCIKQSEPCTLCLYESILTEYYEYTMDFIKINKIKENYKYEIFCKEDASWPFNESGWIPCHNNRMKYFSEEKITEMFNKKLIREIIWTDELLEYLK